MMGLTKRQAECLQAIADLTRDGVAPSISELQARLGLASKSQVHECLKALRDRAAIDWLPGTARSIYIVEPGAKRRADALTAMSDQELFRLIADARAELASRGQPVFPR
jgi:SOS-response transcriptional repressor LexA